MPARRTPTFRNFGSNYKSQSRLYNPIMFGFGGAVIDGLAWSRLDNRIIVRLVSINN
jgi:hypothetical protein